MKPVTGGIVVGLLVVTVAAAAVAFGARSVSSTVGDTPTRVVLVMVADSAEGVSTPRVIADVTTPPAGGAKATLVDPAKQGSVPGTSARTLAEAYSFGGGAAAARIAAGDKVAWVVVPQVALERLVRASGGLTVELPRSIDVFDGRRLYSFQEGEQRITAESFTALFSGADFLTPSDALRARLAAGEAVMTALEASPSLAKDVLSDAAVSSSMSDEMLSDWIAGFVVGFEGHATKTP